MRPRTNAGRLLEGERLALGLTYRELADRVLASAGVRRSLQAVRAACIEGAGSVRSHRRGEPSTPALIAQALGLDGRRLAEAKALDALEVSGRAGTLAELLGPSGPHRVVIDRSRLREFCVRWGISELALFGSILREDFGPDSDVDMLVSFGAGTNPSLIDAAAMREELSMIVGRVVDLVSRRAVERSANNIRRRAILESLDRIYVA